MATDHRYAATRRAEALDVLYIPGVLSTAEAALARGDGCRHLCYAPTDVLDLDHLVDLQIAAPDALFFAAGGIEVAQVEPGVRLGTAGLILDDALIPDGRWTLAQIITAARMLQSLWERLLSA